ncbi:MAG: MFS transporter [Thermoanaerobaculia bacterium]
MLSGDALRRLIVLMFTAFVDMLGSSIIFSQLPFYAQRYGAAAWQVGILISSFFLAQLVTAPLWGRFSDTRGRRPAILAGLLMSGLAFALFGLASTETAHSLLGGSDWARRALGNSDALILGVLMLMRLAQGVGGGTVSVVQAYVSDSSAPKDRAMALGWVTAAISAGVLIGPQLGSLSFRFGAATPGLVAASLCALNFLSALTWLPESLDRSTPSPEPGRPRFSLRQESRDLLARPGSPAGTLMWTYTFGMLAFFSLNGVIGLYLKDVFHFTEVTIGNFFTYVAVISLVSRAAIIGLAVRAVGEVATLRLGALAIALGMLTIPLAHNLPALALTAIFMPLGTALLFPATTSLISQQYEAHDTGKALGVQQAFGGAARVVAPLWATWAYQFDRTLPFWITGGFMVLVCAYTLRVRPDEMRKAATPEAAAGGAG